jgi:hypothetical protein
MWSYRTDDFTHRWFRRRIPTADPHVQFIINSWEIIGGRSGFGTDLCRIFLSFPLPIMITTLLRRPADTSRPLDMSNSTDQAKYGHYTGDRFEEDISEQTGSLSQLT